MAFLSAYQTVTGDVRLPDESIHLAAAMQWLGFRHVLATMWSISDAAAPAVADVVYAALTETASPAPDHAAAALHQAVSTLHSLHPGEPLRWAPYIHIGP